MRNDDVTTACRKGFGLTWKALTAEQRDAVALDVNDMTFGEQPVAECVTDAVVILRRRIGGPVALPGYADVLLAGMRRRAYQAEVRAESRSRGII